MKQPKYHFFNFDLRQTYSRNDKYRTALFLGAIATLLSTFLIHNYLRGTLTFPTIEDFIVSWEPLLTLEGIVLIFGFACVLVLIFMGGHFEDKAIHTKQIDQYQKIGNIFGEETRNEIWQVMAWKKPREVSQS